MPNKTIYLKEEDVDIFERFQKVSKESLSSVITHALREHLEAYEEEAQAQTIKTEAEKKLYQLLKEALQQRASAIYLESVQEGNRVRLRIDGVLREMEAIPKPLYSAILAHLRSFLGEEDAEKPQQGMASLEIEGKPVEILLSFLPCVLGVHVTMRLLEKEMRIPSLKELEPDADHAAIFQEWTQQSHGVVFVTAPTGNGKTTTLYSMIQQINRLERMVVTIESPVELLLKDCIQVPVQLDKGLNFNTLLHSARQADPDVLFVAEIRDLETALGVFETALTGRLVFSVLHSYSAVSAIARLLQIGCPPFMLRETILGVAAQRLVRRLCLKCKESYQKNYPKLKAMSPHLGRTFYKAKGCSECRQIGYSGRLPLFEILQPSSAFKKALLEKASEEELEKIAKKDGMKTLLEEGLFKASQGHTSLTELLHVLEKPEEWLSSF